MKKQEEGKNKYKKRKITIYNFKLTKNFIAKNSFYYRV